MWLSLEIIPMHVGLPILWMHLKVFTTASHSPFETVLPLETNVNVSGQHCWYFSITAVSAAVAGDGSRGSDSLSKVVFKVIYSKTELTIFSLLCIKLQSFVWFLTILGILERCVCDIMHIMNHKIQKHLVYKMFSSVVLPSLAISNVTHIFIHMLCITNVKKCFIVLR